MLDELRFQAERGDFGPGDTDDLIEMVVTIYRRGGTISLEREIAGSGRTLQIYAALTPEGGFVSILTDITEHKRAEDELAAKEAQLRVALDNMPGGMTLCDQDWNYLFFNSQYIELHDYPDGLLKIGGSSNDETRFQTERGDFGPGDPDDLMAEVGAPYRSAKPESYERTLLSGRTLHFNVAQTPEGGYVTIATDITERKQAEEQLQAANTHLSQFSEAVSEYLDPMLVGNLRDGGDVEPRVHFVTVIFWRSGRLHTPQPHHERGVFRHNNSGIRG
jgi:PAS domain-containing protein